MPPSPSLYFVLTRLLLVLSPLFHDSQLPESEQNGVCNKNYQHQLEQRPVRSRPYTILVEGNVGSGKSTLLNFFQGQNSSHRNDIDVAFEPVGQWQNVSGTDLLLEMFRDPGRWAGTFQLYSSLTRYRTVMAPTDKRIRLAERSIYSERFIFLETLHKQGGHDGDAMTNGTSSNGMTDTEYALANEWFKVMTESLGEAIKPDLIIYLRCHMNVLKDRILSRARPEEKSMDPRFLLDLQRRHEGWLLRQDSRFPLPAPVLVVDGNKKLPRFLEWLEENQERILAGAYERDY